MNRPMKRGNIGEEYGGLLDKENGNRILSYVASNKLTAPLVCYHCAFVRARGDKFSTPILICCVFLLGVLCGSNSSKWNMIYTVFPFNVASINSAPRHVHVGSMCRCGSNRVPMPDVNRELISIYQQVPKQSGNGGQDTLLIQSPSKATGSEPKHFYHHPVEGCKCFPGDARIQPEPTSDRFMSQMSRDYFLRPTNLCHESEAASQFNWDQMPDFGVEDLPLFVGVLSYNSHLTLNNTLHNWLKHDFLRRIAAQDVFVQLNHRSREDDDILYEYEKKMKNRHPMTILGSADDNLHPGLAITNFCRRAEEHPSSHPNGENLVLFMEKDWIISERGKQFYLESIFRSAIALSQRGVPYVSLRAMQVTNTKMWECPAEGVGWQCTTSHHHRWTNHPVIIQCNWFLRYLEPFALLSLSDSIMNCGSSFAHKTADNDYCDWEEVLQDGRVAWTNSQWVTAHLRNGGGGPLFMHEEIDT